MDSGEVAPSCTRGVVGFKIEDPFKGEHSYWKVGSSLAPTASIAQRCYGSQVAFELSDGTTSRLMSNASVVQKRGSRSPANSFKDSETLTSKDIPDGLLEDTMCLMVSKPSVSNRASGSTRLGHDMRQYRSFFKNEPLTFRVEAPPMSRSILGSTRKMLERGSKSYLRSAWLAFCVCAAWSLPLCCWAFGRLWCLVLFFFSAVLLSRLVAWLCRSGLCPLRSVSSFSEKKGDDPRNDLQGGIPRTAIFRYPRDRDS